MNRFLTVGERRVSGLPLRGTARSAVRVWARVGVFLIATGTPPVVNAQRNPLAEARELYLAAELEAARRTLQEAEVGGLPDREAYLSVLALRALVLHGLGIDEDRDRDLERLARLAPDRGLPEEAPPSLRERFETFLETTEPVSLEIRTDRTSDGVTLESVVSPEGTEVIDRVILFARLTPESPYQRGANRLTVETTLGGVLEYHAEAVSSDGTPLLTRGTDSEPLRFPFLAAERADDSEGGSILPWILGGSAAVVATAVAIGLAVALSGSDANSFQVGGPTLEGE